MKEDTWMSSNHAYTNCWNYLETHCFLGTVHFLIHPSSQLSGICNPTYLFDIYTYYSLRFHHGHVLEKMRSTSESFFISHRFAGYKLKKELIESNKKTSTNCLLKLHDSKSYQIIQWLSMRNGWDSSYFFEHFKSKVQFDGCLIWRPYHTWFKAKHGF